MKELYLPLRRKWFNMTKAGIKTEDYREINKYWISRLCHKHHLSVIDGGDIADRHTGRQFSLKKFDVNIMTLGYPKATENDRILKMQHIGIEIRTGNPEWGAEPNKIYFVIKHGSFLME